MIHDVKLITADEFRDEWPKTEEGARCARLLRRYAMTVLVNSAEGASCLAEVAGAESGANKAVATMFRHFLTLEVPQPEKKEVKSGLAPLNRFQNPKP